MPDSPQATQGSGLSAQLHPSALCCMAGAAPCHAPGASEALSLSSAPEGALGLAALTRPTARALPVGLARAVVGTAAERMEAAIIVAVEG